MKNTKLYINDNFSGKRLPKKIFSGDKLDVTFLNEKKLKLRQRSDLTSHQRGYHMNNSKNWLEDFETLNSVQDLEFEKQR